MATKTVPVVAPACMIYPQAVSFHGCRSPCCVRHNKQAALVLKPQPTDGDATPVERHTKHFVCLPLHRCHRHTHGGQAYQ